MWARKAGLQPPTYPPSTNRGKKTSKTCTCCYCSSSNEGLCPEDRRGKAYCPEGSRVRQGDTIGYVGATGLATANHLHYEYRLNGVHRNPRTVKLPHADPIKEQYRQRFLASVEPILEEIEQFKNTKVASVGYSNK